MSSRALRKLYGTSDADELAVKNPDGDKNAEDEEEEEEEEEEEVKLTCTNKFLLLNDDDEASPEDEEAQESEIEMKEPKAATTTAASKKKKSSKRKKKKKNGAHLPPNKTIFSDEESEKLDRVLNEFAADIAATSSNNNDHKKSAKKSSSSVSASRKSVLDVEHKHLNIYNELQKIFGSHVLQRDAEYRRRHRNQGAGGGSKGGVWLTQPADSWIKMIKSGLSMKVVNQKADGTTFFKYEHSKEYQEVQFDFLSIVNSFNGEHLHKLLVEKQLNVDALITYSDFCKISEEVQMAREYIERALYVLERFFHPLFSLTTGKCRLEYKYPENRALFICLFKHMHFVARRGCNRTALELCKLLFSLDPAEDPLGAILMMDHYALNCGEYSFISASMREWGVARNLEQLPNWSFSHALAHFHLANEQQQSKSKPSAAAASQQAEETATLERSDELIQDAILRFPTLLMKLLDKCSIQADKRVEGSEYLNKRAADSTSDALNLLSHLYVERSHAAWKDGAVLAWLERNVGATLDIVDANTDTRIKRYTKQRRKRYQRAPLNVHRHALLTEIPGVTSYIPIDIRSQTRLGHDPLPPQDTVLSYTMPQRSPSRRGEHGGTNSIGLFFNSIFPGFDADAQVEQLAQVNPDDGVALQRNQDRIRAGVRQLMEAMQELLVIPQIEQQEEEDDVPFQEWD